MKKTTKPSKSDPHSQSERAAWIMGVQERELVGMFGMDYNKSKALLTRALNKAYEEGFKAGKAASKTTK